MSYGASDRSTASWLTLSLVGVVACWWWLWNVRSYWNPLAFTLLWTCAAVAGRVAAGGAALPVRRHLLLMAVSVPLWWWFELVNAFVQNWHYHGAEHYTALEYQLFATLAFSTVVPALDAAWSAALRWWPGGRVASPTGPLSRRSAWWGLAAGMVAQAAVFLWPTSTYAFVWVAPFLVFDGLVSLRGGPSLLQAMRQGAWQTPLAVASGGLACGVLWELWNYHAMPKWTYDVPLMNFWHVFEMPLLGYGGYVPFVWSVYQMVALAGLLAGKPAAAGAPPLRERSDSRHHTAAPA